MSPAKRHAPASVVAMPPRFRRNIASNYLTTAGSLVIALVTTPLLARGLGPTQYGVWVLVSTFILYLELLEFGFSRATSNFVAEHEAHGRRDQLVRTLTTSLYVLAVPGAVAFGVGLGIAGLFPVVFEAEPAVRSAAQLLIVVLAVDLALSIPADTFGGALVGLQRFDLLNLTLLGISSAQAVAWAVVLSMGGGLVALGVVTTGIGLAGHVARFLLVRRLVPELSLARRNFQRSLVRPFARQSKWFALNDIALIARSRLDTVVVGAIVGVPAAGIYGVGQKLALLVERFSEPVVTIFFPYSAELNARQDQAGLRAAVTLGTRLTLAIAGPLCLVLALLTEPVLELWVGSSFTAAAPVVVALAASAAIKSITYTGALALSGMGQARTPALVLTAEAILNLVLSIALGLRIGLEGVALATLIATVVAEAILMLPLMCRRLGLPMGGFLWSLARAHGLPLALAVMAGHLVGLQPDSLLGLVAAGAAISSTYIGAFFVTGLNREERRQLRERMTRRRMSRRSDAPSSDESTH